MAPTPHGAAPVTPKAHHSVGRSPKAGDPAAAGAPVDPRVVLMIGEAFRHGKAIGGWGNADVALAAAGCLATDPGVVVDTDPSAGLAEVVELLGRHRVWARFTVSVP